MRSQLLTFSLLVANPAQLTINTFVRTLLNWMQILGVPTAATLPGSASCGSRGWSSALRTRMRTTAPWLLLITLYLRDARGRRGSPGRVGERKQHLLTITLVQMKFYHAFQRHNDLHIRFRIGLILKYVIIIIKGTLVSGSKTKE